MKRRILSLVLALCLTAAFIVPASASGGLVGTWAGVDYWGESIEFAFSADGKFYAVTISEYYYSSDYHFSSVNVSEGTYTVTSNSIILDIEWDIWYDDDSYRKYPESSTEVLKFSLRGDTLTIVDDYIFDYDTLILTRGEPSGVWDFGMGETFEGPPAPPAPNIALASEWAREGINEAYRKGFIPEEILGSYTAAITRAEFCRMAVRVVEYALRKNNISAVLNERNLVRDYTAFTDTSDSDILAAHALGITSGVGGKSFAPHTGFTREQAAAMIVNTVSAIGADTEDLPNADFTDMDEAADWAHPSINFVRANGIMSGTGGGNFGPKDIYTREQSIVAFNNIDLAGLMGWIVLGGRIFDGTETRIDLSWENISDISALSGFTKLTRLDLSYNNITDISALEGLTGLTSLDLWNNDISDISALSGLTNLTYLDLDSNNISDITALEGLAKLKTLYLYGNPLTQEQVDVLREALPNCRIFYNHDYWDNWDDDEDWYM
jgi:hypothetical protein